ncbi:MAG: alpha/beta hydrolase [Candidatus Pacebacteria bacterium]|nr:alpha/beta hydrolase [Candidatus Paceibacterota bacterium]
MSRGLIYNIVGVIVVLAVIFFKIPAVWVILGVFVFLIFIIFDPFMPSVEGIPKGFSEKKFNTGKIILNYIEGPDNGPPLLFIPGQMEFWQGYKLVIPNFSKNYHVFVVDVRGHGKSTKTPGEYSYNIIGEDFKEFLEKVVKKPAIVSGLSSGAILSLWLAANASESVSIAISEDPPLFSSMWPRIKEEKYMYRLFEVAVECLGKPKRDILGFFMEQGIPKDGYENLFLIPPWIAKFIVGLFELNKKFRPSKQYDIPLAPFSGRVGFKFLCEYDVDFSKATIDGRLTEGFDPEETLKKIKCPVLLIQARWSRHKTWGLMGALDDEDAGKISAIVKNVKVVKVNAIHDVHLAQPKTFIKAVNDYLLELKHEQ